MQIVSANYRNRKSPKRWLIRDAAQKPEEAVECMAVLATGVAFCPSTAYETGFGCSTVAFCESATGFQTASQPMPNEVKLHFNGAYFVTESGQHVPVCQTLRLQPDGSMTAQLLVQKARPAKAERTRARARA